MKKKVGMTLAALLAAAVVLSVTAHRAEPPQAVIGSGDGGTAISITDTLRQEQPGEVEKKTVSQTMTLESETDKMEDILPLLKSTMDYRVDGFSGTLILDRDSIQTKETGTSNYSYQLKETKEYTGLDRNDPYYIPRPPRKTALPSNWRR